MAHMSSTANKNIDVSDDQEESGWTAYFEDYLSYSNKESSFITPTSPSLVSDAAWNGTDHVRVNRSKMLSFKNLKKKKKINNKQYPQKYDDDDDGDDLEDTASSPVNSPKVSSLKHMEVNHRRTHRDVYVGNFLGKEGLSLNDNFSRHGDFEKIDDVIKDNLNEYVVDLENKGLCLVPTSAFMNYFR